MTALRKPERSYVSSSRLVDAINAKMAGAVHVFGEDGAALLADVVAPKLAQLLAQELAPAIAEELRLSTLLGDDALLTRKEAAAALGVSTKSLEAWARDGSGPKVVRYGERGVGYRISSLRAFMADRETIRAK